MSSLSSNSEGLLDGLRIIEISSFVAAPLGGLTLAQLGADVIRIDPIGGAADRGRWPLSSNGSSLYWAGLNKGKRSLEVDFRSDRGRKLIYDLLEASGDQGGILLSNAVGRPWLEDDQLRAVRSDLIHVHVQGHHDGRPAVDYTVNAAFGFPMMTGPSSLADPVNHVLPAWDIACGLHASIAILAADRWRRETGEGEYLTIALYDVALSMVSHLGLLAEAQLNDVDRGRIGNHLYGGFGRDFVSKDDKHVMVVALTKRHWSRLTEVTSTTELFGDLERILGCDFASESDRYRHREAIAAILAPWFRDRRLIEIEHALAQTPILWSPYRTIHEIVTHGASELQDHPMMFDTLQPGVGSYWSAASPIDRRRNGTRLAAKPAPIPGADSALIHDHVYFEDESSAFSKGFPAK